MDQGMKSLTGALTAAAAAWGHDIVVNGPMIRDGPSVNVTLGRDRGSGRIVMLRRPMANEGGMRTCVEFAVAPDQDAIPDDIRANIAMWAIGLTRIRQHEARLKTLGLAPDAFDSSCAIVNPVAMKVAAAIGAPLADRLASGLWSSSDNGHEMRPARGGGLITRYLEDIRLQGVNVGGDGASSIVVTDEDDGRMTIRLVTRERLPETVMIAARGRDLTDLIELPGMSGPTGFLIDEARSVEAGTHPAGIEITTTCTRKAMS